MSCNCPHCGKAIPIEVIEQMAFDYDPIELVTLPADVAAAAGLARQPTLHSSKPFPAAVADAHDPGENYADADTGKPLTVGEMLRAGNAVMGVDVANGDDQTETAFICNNCRAIVNPDVQHVCPCQHAQADAPTFLSK